MRSSDLAPKILPFSEIIFTNTDSYPSGRAVQAMVFHYGKRHGIARNKKGYFGHS